MGVLRMGWITKLLSHAVISGFTTGAAITIALGQVRALCTENVLCLGHQWTLSESVPPLVGAGV